MAGLENQVTQLRDNYEQREGKLITERDEALQQARWVEFRSNSQGSHDHVTVGWQQTS